MVVMQAKCVFSCEWLDKRTGEGLLMAFVRREGGWEGQPFPNYTSVSIGLERRRVWKKWWWTLDIGGGAYNPLFSDEKEETISGY